MGETPIPKLLLKLAPPVMAALLIQSIYNVVDSFFIATYSERGLTALSILYPLQLLMTALGTGSGCGLNILISRYDGYGENNRQKSLIKSGLGIGVANYILFVLLSIFLLGSYLRLSSDQPAVQTLGYSYGQIVLFGSLGLFLESIGTKILQARGNMRIPMAAQITGALINICLDPILIFGFGPVPSMGVSGAAIATVIGQWAAMCIVLIPILRQQALSFRGSLTDCRQIYKTAIPSIVMQSLYTFYIVGLNLILKLFTEDAVTVLGLYYKIQMFFFIPLMGLQQVIIPIISYNYGAGKKHRVHQTLGWSLSISAGVMILATAVFLFIPNRLLQIFASNPAILSIGTVAFRIISISFLPAAGVMMLTVYFQSMEQEKKSLTMIILRQIVLLVPLAWVFHYLGLRAVWFTFPVSEIVTLAVGFYFYFRERKTAESI